MKDFKKIYYNSLNEIVLYIYKIRYKELMFFYWFLVFDNFIVVIIYIFVGYVFIV